MMHFSMGVSFAQNPGCCKERERERESFNCILSLVPYPPKNVSHMLLTLFFFGCCLPHFVDAESDAKCSMGYHTLPSIPRKFQTWSEVFFPGVFFLFWVGFCLPEFEWLGKGQKKKKTRVMKKQTSDSRVPTASSLQMQRMSDAG